MNNENTEKLFADFPRLFKGKDYGMQRNLMCFGFECDDGWFDLIYQLCQDIEVAYAKLPEEKKLDDYNDACIAFQVKEKFGGLRFYLDSEADGVYELTSTAETKSFTICEICGEPGKPSGRGWIKTLCEMHRDERDAAKARIAEQREKENGS